MDKEITLADRLKSELRSGTMSVYDFNNFIDQYEESSRIFPFYGKGDRWSLGIERLFKDGSTLKHLHLDDLAQCLFREAVNGG